jgi:hypothetical protein
VANVFGAHLSGLVAWILWVLIHVMYLVTFQKRPLAFTRLALQDLIFSRGDRLIISTAPTALNSSKKVAVYRHAPKSLTNMSAEFECTARERSARS